MAAACVAESLFVVEWPCCVGNPDGLPLRVSQDGAGLQSLFALNLQSSLERQPSYPPWAAAPRGLPAMGVRVAQGSQDHGGLPSAECHLPSELTLKL
jgi:hypothetical protein